MILAIDQGTTGTTCLVFDRDGRIAGRAYSEFRQHFPRPGWVEHDANEIWDVTRRVGAEAISDAGISGGEPDGDRDHQPARDGRRLGPGARGEPVHHALVWQDRRTAGRCDELRAAGHADLVRERTGPGHRPLLLGDQDRVASAQRRGGAGRRLRHDRLLARLQAHRPARHRLLQRLADDALRHPRAALGPGALRAAGRRSGAALPEPVPFVAGLRAHRRLRRRRAGGRDRRRPAGGALRPGLPPARDGEEHLRHRQLRPAQHRRRGAPSPARAC